VSAGGYQRAGAQSRLRAAVNARLEEISFRAGVAAATIALVALSAIAAAGVYAATLSLGTQTVAAAGALGATGTAKTIPATTASAQPSTPPRPRARSAPKAKPPMTAATISPQSTAGSQPWPQADGSQVSSRHYERADFSGYGSFGTDGPFRGGIGLRPGGQGFGFSGHGR
jgi:hypothetical protein